MELVHSAIRACNNRETAEQLILHLFKDEVIEEMLHYLKEQGWDVYYGFYREGMPMSDHATRCTVCVLYMKQLVIDIIRGEDITLHPQFRKDLAQMSYDFTLCQ